jgi:hypothetical protein
MSTATKIRYAISVLLLFSGGLIFIVMVLRVTIPYEHLVAMVIPMDMLPMPPPPDGDEELRNNLIASVISILGLVLYPYNEEKRHSK